MYLAREGGMYVNYQSRSVTLLPKNGTGTYDGCDISITMMIYFVRITPERV
jgi:hypothetical protein